jgi:hypothetical protein
MPKTIEEIKKLPAEEQTDLLGRPHYVYTMMKAEDPLAEGATSKSKALVEIIEKLPPQNQRYVLDAPGVKGTLRAAGQNGWVEKTERLLKTVLGDVERIRG